MWEQGILLSLCRVKKPEAHLHLADLLPLPTKTTAYEVLNMSQTFSLTQNYPIRPQWPMDIKHVFFSATQQKENWTTWIEHEIEADQSGVSGDAGAQPIRRGGSRLEFGGRKISS